MSLLSPTAQSKYKANYMEVFIMKKLKERKKLFKIFQTISMTCCILGFLLCVGGIGHIELYDISQTPLT